jgi:hypothetical protein
MIENLPQPDRFPPEVQSRLGWYVYRLIDPRNGWTIYVGKGQGNRVFEHAKDSLKSDNAEDGQSLKLKKIREILDAGLPVQHVIHRHGLASEEIAFEVEAALMDAFSGLTNIAGGHGSLERGCQHVGQIINTYSAPRMVVHEPLILIYIGKARAEDRSVYDSVRAAWRMSKVEAEKRKLVLAYDGNLVIGAFRPTQWLEANKQNFPFLADDMPKGRIGFNGVEAEDPVSRLYLGTCPVPRKRGEQTPFRYFSPNDDSAEEIS